MMQPSRANVRVDVPDDFNPQGAGGEPEWEGGEPAQLAVALLVCHARALRCAGRYSAAGLGSTNASGAGGLTMPGSQQPLPDGPYSTGISGP